MRFALSVLLLLLPAAAFADNFTIVPSVASVQVYPQGATLTLQAQLDAPAGNHRIFLPSDDAVQGEVPAIRLSPGVQLTEISQRRSVIFDAEATYSAQQRAAFEQLERLRENLLQHDAIITRQARAIEAMELQARFLGSVTGASDVVPDAEAIKAMSDFLGRELAQIFSVQEGAKSDLRRLQDERTELAAEVALAEQALDALRPPQSGADMLVLGVSVAQAGPVTVSFDVFTNLAGWAPSYELVSAGTNAAKATLRRNVLIRNDTAYTWDAIGLTLSTAQLNRQSAPSPEWQNTARIGPQRPVRPAPSALARELSSVDMAAPVIAQEPIMAEAVMEAAVAQTEGAVVQYRFSDPVTLSETETILPFDEMDLASEFNLVAVPRLDPTAFWLASLTNESAEPLLSGPVALWRGDQLVARTVLPEIPAGETADIGFGAENSVRISRVVLNRETGDRGLVARSNRRVDSVELEFRNIGEDAKTLRALYATPVSEQEDLKINVEMQPQPDEQNLDNRRGVHGWDISLEPGGTKTVRIDITMTWPEDLELRWSGP